MRLAVLALSVLLLGCTPVPSTQLCTTDAIPRCGVDGKIYIGDCGLKKAGVAEDHTGKCGKRSPASPAP